ncbi:hypothetical protein D7X33_07920 [Butyricicoccus sp. 1XD8-22]|nr:hypothetical protein D7X33_07920 [Butyricicoccus sp. 1XD8-22]
MSALTKLHNAQFFWVEWLANLKKLCYPIIRKKKAPRARAERPPGAGQWDSGCWQMGAKFSFGCVHVNALPPLFFYKT